jgi:E3 ubiquitin-protein ligase UHRF1
LLSGPDKPAANGTKTRKRKSTTVDPAAGSPRRSLRRKTRASAGENPDDEYECQSLGGSDYDEDMDLVEPTSKASRKNRAVDYTTTRRYREPVIKATGNYRVICIRHPDGTYEEDGKVTDSPSVSQTDASESSNPPPVPKTKGLSKDQRDLAASKIFGHQPRVPIGRWYPGRRGFHDALIHRGLVNGIFGDEEEGAYSVSVSGGYEDDVDEGYKFVFTGEGGRHLNVDPKTGKAKNLRTAPQTRAQGMKKGNLALKRSCETGNPVRVIRGYKGKSVWAPREGYRYDGVSAQLGVTRTYADTLCSSIKSSRCGKILAYLDIQYLGSLSSGCPTNLLLTRQVRTRISPASPGDTDITW